MNIVTHKFRIETEQTLLMEPFSRTAKLSSYIINSIYKEYTQQARGSQSRISIGVILIIQPNKTTFLMTYSLITRASK